MNRNSKEGEPTPSPKSIIWVDDQPHRLATFKTMLERKIGGKIEFISDAQEALKQLEKRAEENRLPAVIISDLSMPNMSGLEFAEAVKSHQDEEIKSLPFCIVSGFVSYENEDRLEELGVLIIEKVDLFQKTQQIRQFYEERK